ncbi:hypothetical protein [Onishia niordana]|uniref:hypothetical protein n=1 Tax=Onishia niordana TaxID=2508711 RepID=UPI00109FD957|nr:hypothetical protein [Halomonas niordiana]
MDKMLEKAFESLSVSCNKSGLHALDEDNIKVTLRTLQKNGVPIDINSLDSWLVDNNWQQTPRKAIVFWAKAVSRGGRVQVKNKESAPTEKEVWERLNA